jgi:hypothetical protein
VIATVREDGSPHATPVWIDYDGANVLVNSAYGRTKVKKGSPALVSRRQRFGGGAVEPVGISEISPRVARPIRKT